MAYTTEGTIEIELVDFWTFVEKFHSMDGAEIKYGVPRVNVSNQTMEIDFAASDIGDPADWSVKPKAITQWEELD